jgi:heme-degrading monooxygenase HmoA
MAIIRVFRARVRPGKQAEFERFFRESALPYLRGRPGLLAQHVGRPLEPTAAEFVYVTVWEDLAALQAFAGEEWQAAHLLPEEVPLLQETLVDHYASLDA